MKTYLEEVVPWTVKPISQFHFSYSLTFFIGIIENIVK